MSNRYECEGEGECENCEYCEYDGFPCLNCADHCHEGTMGPGCCDGIRFILPTYPTEVQERMKEYANAHGIEYNESSIEHFNFPTNPGYEAEEFADY